MIFFLLNGHSEPQGEESPAICLTKQALRGPSLLAQDDN